MVEEGLEKGLCALESRDLIFNCSSGQFSVCGPFPGCGGVGPPPRGGLGFIRNPVFRRLCLWG